MSKRFEVRSPIKALVASVRPKVGDAVAAGDTIAILEAMKMEHVVATEQSGVVQELRVAVDSVVEAGDVLAVLDAAEVRTLDSTTPSPSFETVRADLVELYEREAFGLDAQRPAAVEKRRRTGQRTARENLADLVDEGSFVEYGALVIAAQRQRRAHDELVARTPADGMVAGIGRINGALFGTTSTRAVVTSYDYTVLAGTQGTMNHLK